MTQTILIIDMAEPFISHIDSQNKQILISNQVKYLKTINKKVNIISMGYSKTDETIQQLKEVIQKSPNSQYLEKPNTNCFDKTQLLNILQKLQTTQLLCIGIFASECVKETVKTGIKYFQVLINPELIQDPSDWEENKSIKWYSKNAKIFNS
jgi:nicotinamidase-related amidase